MSAPQREVAVDLTIFVPAYNEEKLIGKTLDEIRNAASKFSFSYEVLVYDDASRDRTADVVREWIAAHKAEGVVRVISNEKNAGIGVNYFRAAEQGTGEYFMVVFGDNAEPEESLRRVFNLMGKADVIIPYFDTRLFNMRHNGDNRTFIRRLISIVFAAMVRLISGHCIRYYNGFVMHRRTNVLKHRVSAYGLGYQAELLCSILNEPGISYLEVKCFNNDRASGMPTAFKLKNVVSVGQSLWRIFMRRFTALPAG